jgi:ATP-dependent Clp protease protease subunit
VKVMAKGKRAEVLLYDDIGGWFGVTAADFAKEIKAAGAVDEIDLRINSNGGSVFEGIAIYNFLRSHKAKVNVHVDGLAASIASVIAMAGDTVSMADNAWMMIHDPWIMTAGNASELRTIADQMDGFRDSLLDTYMTRASAKREAISEMMAGETWLNATDAKKFGLVDGVTPALQIAASVRREWFRHVPDALATVSYAKQSRDPSKHREQMARMEQHARRHLKSMV